MILQAITAISDEESKAGRANGAGIAAMIRPHDAVKHFSGVDGQKISVWLVQFTCKTDSKVAKNKRLGFGDVTIPDGAAYAAYEQLREQE